MRAAGRTWISLQKRSQGASWATDGGEQSKAGVLMHIPFAFPDHQDSRESPTLLVNWSELDDLHAEKRGLISGTSDFNLKMASYSGKAVVVRRSCCALPIVPAVSPPRR